MYGNERIRKFINNLTKVKNNNDSIIVMSNESGIDTTRVIYIDYIGERWCKGHSIAYIDDKQYSIPETINYADIITMGSGLGLKVIFPEYVEGGD